MELRYKFNSFIVKTMLLTKIAFIAHTQKNLCLIILSKYVDNHFSEFVVLLYCWLCIFQLNNHREFVHKYMMDVIYNAAGSRLHLLIVNHNKTQL